MFDFLRGEKKTLQAPTEPSKISVKEEKILEEEELYVADEEDFVDELERIFEMEDEADLDGFLDLEESEAIAIEGPPEPIMQEEPAPEIPLGGMEAPTGEKGAIPTPKKKSKARKKAAPKKKDEAPSLGSKARRRTSGLREQAKEEQIEGPGLSLGQPPPAEGAGGAPFPPPAPMAPSVPRSPAAPAPPAPRAPAPPAPAPSQAAAPPPPPLASFDAPAMEPPEVPSPPTPKRGAAPAKPPTGPGGPPVAEAPAPAQAAPPPPKSSMAPPPVVAHIPAPTPLAPAPDEVEIPEPSSEYAAAETPYFADDEEISLSKSEAPPIGEFGRRDADDDDDVTVGMAPPQPSLGDMEERYGMAAPIDRRDTEEKKVYPELYGGEEAPVDANLTRPKPTAPDLDRHPTPDLEVPATRQAPLPSSMPPPAPLQPAAKSSGGFLRGCAKVVGGIILAPIILPTFLVVGVVWGCAKIVQGIFRGFGWLFMKGFSHLEKKAKEKGVPTFEMFFSDNAGKPGPLERAVAHSAMMSRAIQATVGVRFVLFIHAIDTFVDLFVGYISGIYQSWKMMKTISRKIRREMDGSQADSVAEDLAECRVRLARIFAFAGCYSEELRMRFSEHERLRDVTKSSFPLKEILGVRGHIDDMERDLNFLTSAQTVAFLKGSVWRFFGSLIPNPFQFLTAWKDIFIMIFFMRYPRRDIEFMMADLLHSYQTTIGFLRLLLKDAEQAGEIDLDGQQKRLLIEALMEYEEVLLARTGAVGGAMEIPELTDAVERDRNSLQRLNRVLCSPTRTVEPRYWSRFDLLKEALHIEEAGRFHPHIALEVEGWLTRQVERAMNEKGLKVDRSEKERRLREALDYHKRLKLYRKAERKHLFF